MESRRVTFHVLFTLKFNKSVASGLIVLILDNSDLKGKKGKVEIG